MTFQEKSLYHQIHPLKLSTDILSAAVSLYFFWIHALVTGFAVHIVPPVIVTAVLVGGVDLAAQKNSRLGRYVAQFMTRRVEAIRLAGDLCLIAGAWWHLPALIALGLLVILWAWSSGLLPAIRSRGRRQAR